MTITHYLTKAEIIELYSKGYLMRPKIPLNKDPQEKLEFEIFMLYDEAWSKGVELNG